MEMYLYFLGGFAFALIIFIFTYKLILKNQELRFSQLSQNILNSHSDQFKNIASENINSIVDPLHTRLKEYRDLINTTHGESLKDRESLRERISHMMDSAVRIEKETNHLTQALTGDVKFQGDWGEVILEKVLDLAGLEKGKEYITQNNLKLEGQSYRPDVIINLPENSHIIIDSKVSLKSYFDYLNSDDADNALKLLKLSIKSHIDGLAKKNYQMLEGINSPEFVYLFIPVEGVYSLILKEFPEIIDESIKKNIFLVSPINLMANLKTVASVWRLAKQSDNAHELATKAGAMYDKFVLLLDDLNKLGQSMNKTQGLHNDIVARLGSGRGNLIDKSIELKDLGAKTSKSLRSDYMN